MKNHYYRTFLGPLLLGVVFWGFGDMLSQNVGTVDTSRFTGLTDLSLTQDIPQIVWYNTTILSQGVVTLGLWIPESLGEPDVLAVVNVTVASEGFILREGHNHVPPVALFFSIRTANVSDILGLSFTLQAPYSETTVQYSFSARGVCSICIRHKLTFRSQSIQNILILYAYHSMLTRPVPLTSHYGLKPIIRMIFLIRRLLEGEKVLELQLD